MISQLIEKVGLFWFLICHCCIITKKNFSRFLHKILTLSGLTSLSILNRIRCLLFHNKIHSKKISYDWIFYYTIDFNVISWKSRQNLEKLKKIKKMADVFLPYCQFLLRKSVIKDVQADKRRKNSKQLKNWDAWIKQSLKKWTFLTFFS